MRTALCLSGQIRSFDLTKQNLLEHIIQPNNCDVFCHFWYKSTKEKYKVFYRNEDGKIVEHFDTEAYGSYGDENLQDTIDFLNAKLFLLEEPHFQANPKSMFYSIWKCNQLKSNYELRHGFIYDVVVRARSDLIYSHAFEFPKCEENTIHVKNRPVPNKLLSVNDWFAYGNSNSMDIYSQPFSEYEETQRIEELCPEELLKKHLDNNNIQTSISGVDFHIVRADGKEVW